MAGMQLAETPKRLDERQAPEAVKKFGPSVANEGIEGENPKGMLLNFNSLSQQQPGMKKSGPEPGQKNGQRPNMGFHL